jgi:hypothetical protein
MKKSKIERLRDAMYYMFLDGVPLAENLDMQDCENMWLALMEHWNIPVPDTWGKFITDVNSTLSNDKAWFNHVFDVHFNKH